MFGSKRRREETASLQAEIEKLLYGPSWHPYRRFWGDDALTKHIKTMKAKDDWNDGDSSDALEFVRIHLIPQFVELGRQAATAAEFRPLAEEASAIVGMAAPNWTPPPAPRKPYDEAEAIHHIHVQISEYLKNVESIKVHEYSSTSVKMFLMKKKEGSLFGGDWPPWMYSNDEGFYVRAAMAFVRELFDTSVDSGKSFYKIANVDYAQRRIDALAKVLGVAAPVLMDLERVPLPVGDDAGPSMTGQGKRDDYKLLTDRTPPADLAAWQADAVQALAAWNAAVAERRAAQGTTSRDVHLQLGGRDSAASPDQLTLDDTTDEARLARIERLVLDPNTPPGERRAALEAYGRLKSKGRG
ncbi:MAG: hypothetical protein B7W99_00920 [Rhodospirillales bacterium 20-58-10]|nr:MAG: hypothetical protein B7W99_00920 [Rhodospirillales bacterium 20-58-10]